MAQAASFQRTSVPGGHLVKVSGPIDENFDPVSFSQGLDGVVVLDLDGVPRITSIGIRRWVEALGLLRANYYCFVNVRPNLVSQFNMVPDFAGQGELLTFYVPCLCEKCSKYFDSLFDRRTQHAEIRTLDPPMPPCPDCKGPSVLDDLPEVYFSHLASLAPPSPAPLVASILSGKSQPKDFPFRAQKDVAGELTALWLSGNSDRGVNFARLVDGLEGQVVLVAAELGVGAAKGLVSLLEALRAQPVQTTLARVPRDVLVEVAKVETALDKVALFSVLLEGKCPKEHPQRLEATAAAGLLASLEGVCADCGGAFAFSPGHFVGTQLARSEARQPTPSATVAYLRDHQAPPKRSGDTRRLGRYELLKDLGMGGMARVYQARQSGLGGFEKVLAIKSILPNLSSDPYFIRMFLEEARLAARITHPNVVQIFEIDHADGQYYIAMEYVDGCDLNTLLSVAKKHAQQIPISVALALAADVFAGLQAAHSSADASGKETPIMHRDVTPHNVLVARSGVAKLSDFGIAKANDAPSRTPGNAVRGKLAYLAPEILVQGDPVDVRSDLFSAGIILYELLTLVHPFRLPTEFGTIAAISRHTPERVTTLRPELPNELNLVVERVLAKSPAQRYATAQVVRQALKDVLTQLPGPHVEIADWFASLMALATRPPLKKETTGEDTKPG